MDFAIAPPLSQADAMNASMRNPLSAMRINDGSDCRPAASFLAAKLAATPDEKRGVRDVALRLIGVGSDENLRVTQTLQAVNPSSATASDFLPKAVAHYEVSQRSCGLNCPIPPTSSGWRSAWTAMFAYAALWPVLCGAAIDPESRKSPPRWPRTLAGLSVPSSNETVPPALNPRHRLRPERRPAPVGLGSTWMLSRAAPNPAGPLWNTDRQRFVPASDESRAIVPWASPGRIHSAITDPTKRLGGQGSGENSAGPLVRCPPRVGCKSKISRHPRHAEIL